MDPRFGETRFVVEATSFEQHVLWSLYKACVSTWERDGLGASVTVGECAGKPVVVSCAWARLDGVLVLFFEAVSQVVDNDMVDAWLRVNCCPQCGDGRRALTDAGNFHQVMTFIVNQR